MSFRVQHRLFFAILPPAGPRGVIAHLARGIAPDADLIDAGRLHITLPITRDFDQFPHDQARAMLAVGADIAAGPIAIALDQVRGGNRSVVLRPRRMIGGLNRLEKRLDRRCRARRVALRDRHFSAHVTMLYRNGRPFVRSTAPVDWTARDLVLIHSEVGATRHHVLGHWALDSNDAADGDGDSQVFRKQKQYIEIAASPGFATNWRKRLAPPPAADWARVPHLIRPVDTP